MFNSLTLTETLLNEIKDYKHFTSIVSSKLPARFNFSQLFIGKIQLILTQRKRRTNVNNVSASLNDLDCDSYWFGIDNLTLKLFLQRSPLKEMKD